MKVALFLIIASIAVPSLACSLEKHKCMDLYAQHRHQFSTNCNQEILEELDGAHLRFAASHYPNVMIIETSPGDNGTFRYSGFAVDACNYMAQAFKFTYSFVNSPKEDLQTLSIMDSEIKLLIQGDVDMVTTEVALSLARFRRFDVSIPLYTSGIALLVPWPDEESRLLAVIHPFQPMVWLVLLVILPTMVLIFAIIPGIRHKLLKTNTNNSGNDDPQVLSVSQLSDGALSIVANLTGHSSALPSFRKYRQLFYRILLGSWFLAILVLVNAYSSLLISYLTIPTLMPVAKNYDDLAYRKVQYYEGITEKGGIGADLMFNQVDEAYTKSRLFKRSQIFAEMYRQHPERLFTNLKQRFDLMFNGKFAYAQSELLFYTFLDELNKRAGYCKFTVSCKHMDDLRNYQRVFLFRKQWRYTDPMRNKLQWWTDTGLALHWIKSYQPSPKGCVLQDYKKNAPRIRVLTLKDLSSAFVVLLMGSGASLFVFIIEKIRYKCSIHRGLLDQQEIEVKEIARNNDNEVEGAQNIALD